MSKIKKIIAVAVVCLALILTLIIPVSAVTTTNYVGDRTITWYVENMDTMESSLWHTKELVTYNNTSVDYSNMTGGKTEFTLTAPEGDLFSVSETGQITGVLEFYLNASYNVFDKGIRLMYWNDTYDTYEYKSIDKGAFIKNNVSTRKGVNSGNGNTIYYYRWEFTLDCSTFPTPTFNGFDIDIYFDLDEVKNNNWVQWVVNEFEFNPVSQADMEKEEATGQGNSNVDELQGALPNATDGFGDAIKNFTNSMSYTGTEVKWTFPAIYIPAINGLFDRIELTPEYDIDIGKMITQYIPGAILTLVQYLLTVALIIYCAKEMWGWIQYAMSLRKGNSA